MNEPRISVVTPSFNQARFLERTLRSVFDQGYPNLQYIVVDGGSTDGSVDLIRKYEHRLHYWVSEPDAGQTDALVKGFERADGDIFCWLNSDDLFEPHTLGEVAEFFQSHLDARAVYGDAIWIDVDDNPMHAKREHPFNRFIWLNDYNYIPQPSTFWRRDLYEQVGGLDRRFNLAMDADLWIRFADVTRLHHVPRIWSRMRFYPEQKNQRLRGESNREDQVIRSRYMPPRSPWVTMQRKATAKGLRVGWKLLRGCYGGGRKLPSYGARRRLVSR